jgi:hypothetical protein
MNFILKTVRFGVQTGVDLGEVPAKYLTDEQQVGLQRI